MFEAIIFVSILFVFLTTFIFWCCEKKRDLDTRIIGGAFIAYSFISVFTQIYLLPILEISDWDKRISLQMQLTALAVGLTAAIIAFRNYQRKSGIELTYIAKFNEGNFDNQFCIVNSKDRNITIFRVMIKYKNISIVLPFEYPISLAGYASILKKFGRVGSFYSYNHHGYFDVQNDDDRHWEHQMAANDRYYISVNSGQEILNILATKEFDVYVSTNMYASPIKLKQQNIVDIAKNEIHIDEVRYLLEGTNYDKHLEEDFFQTAHELELIDENGSFSVQEWN